MIGKDELRQEFGLIESSRTPICIWDFGCGIVLWNRGCEELYGYSRQEVRGVRRQDLLQTTVPGSTFEELSQKLRDDGSWSGKLLQTTKQAAVVTVESRIEILDVGKRQLVFESSWDVTERERDEERYRVFLNDVGHRVSNTLAVVQSMARQTLRSAKDQRQFAEIFEGRVQSLARAHHQLVRGRWEGTDLEELARSQLAAHGTKDSGRLFVEGPAVRLSPAVATPLGLVIHELATNAARYGAFSVDTGQVSLTWEHQQHDGARRLTVVWSERGGPPVIAPIKRGFGGSLIERSLPHSRVTHGFAPEGVRCTIEFDLGEENFSQQKGHGDHG